MKTLKLAVIGLVTVAWSLVSVSFAGGESAQTQGPIDYLGTQSLVLQSTAPQECTNHCDDISCFSSTFGVTTTESPCDSDSDGDVDGVDLTGLAGLLKNTFEFEGGKAQLPNDGTRLLVLTMNEEYLGSVTYFGDLDDQGDPLLTGFSIDIGEGTCNGSVDLQKRPIELTFPNGAVLSFSYNADGTFNFTLVNGDTLYSGENIVPIGENTSSTAESNASIGYALASGGFTLSDPITGPEVAVYRKAILNNSANRVCQSHITGFGDCFASSILTELMENIADFFLVANFLHINDRQVIFTYAKLFNLGRCNTPGDPNHNANLCKIAPALLQGWTDHSDMIKTALYFAVKSLSEDMVNDPNGNVTFAQLCTCNPVAYTGLGEYSHSIIAKFGNMGRVTCESDAVWSLVLNPDHTVEGVYVILKQAYQTTNGDAYCTDLNPPQVANLAGEYQDNDRTFWVQGGDFFGGNRFEGSYSLWKMTGSGSYEDIGPMWESYSHHTNVTLYRAECDLDSDCSDGKWCTGFEECFFGTCLEGNSPCEENEICDEATYKCLSPPAALN
jgi:hypothetical protein